MHAPVNLFFDITPIGKIIRIFTEDMNVFKGELLDKCEQIIRIFSHVAVMVGLVSCFGSWEITLTSLLILALMVKVSIPWLSAENQIEKVGSTLWDPIFSYFHECMRGTSIVRAFGQEDMIMSRQHAMLDRTTQHFIAHQSCMSWYNIRMYYASMFLTALCFLLIAKHRLAVDSVTLVMFYSQTIDMHWIMSSVTLMNQMSRGMIKAERVFNLHGIPQEARHRDDVETAETRGDDDYTGL